jgi:hypothetical protein
MSNRALAKAKSWELPFYRKARRSASKKNNPFLNHAPTGGSASPKMPVRLGPMAETIAEGPDIRRQSRIYFANALRTTRSTN